MMLAIGHVPRHLTANTRRSALANLETDRGLRATRHAIESFQTGKIVSRRVYTNRRMGRSLIIQGARDNMFIPFHKTKQRPSRPLRKRLNRVTAFVFAPPICRDGGQVPRSVRQLRQLSSKGTQTLQQLKSHGSRTLNCIPFEHEHE